MTARLQRMTEIGELTRTPVVENGCRVYHYTPNVTATTNSFISVLIDEIKEKERAAKREQDEQCRQPWRTINRCDDSRKPIPSQGGQGSVNGFFTGSVLNYIGD